MTEITFEDLIDFWVSTGMERDYAEMLTFDDLYEAIELCDKAEEFANFW